MLIEQIQKDTLAARKAGDTVRSSLLITLFSEASMVGKNAGNRVTTDQETIAVVRKFLKGVDESLAVVKDQARVAALKVEKEVLTSYLPVQMNDEQITEALEKILADKGIAREAKSMGLLMKELKAQHEGSYDGGKASTLVKSVLSAKAG